MKTLIEKLQKVLKQTKDWESHIQNALKDAIEGIEDLVQENKELKAVVYAYDSCINKLPKDDLILFTNLTPPKFIEGLKKLNIN